MSWNVITVSLQAAASMLAIAVVACLLFAALTSAAYLALNRQIGWPAFLRTAAEIFFVSLPFAVVGIVAGYLTGNSRSPAVTALVPGILTLFGGLTAYLMAQGVRMALLSGIAVVAFSSLLFMGSFVGSLQRQAYDTGRASVSERLAEVERELAVQMFRKNLGLPEANPPSTKTDESK